MLGIIARDVRLKVVVPVLAQWGRRSSFIKCRLESLKDAHVFPFGWRFVIAGIDGFKGIVINNMKLG